MKIEWLTNQFIKLNMPEAVAQITATLMLAFLACLVAVVATFIARKTLIRFTISWITRKKFLWGPPLLRTNFFQRLSLLIPLALFSLAADSLFAGNESIHILTQRLLLTGFVVIAIGIVTALLTAIKEIDLTVRHTKQSTLQGYIDATKIISYVVGVIFIISIFSGRSPWGIFSILGGLTAVIILVFKDTILGFVASLQLSASDLVRVGDWIEMPQYNANGDVLSVSIHTVRVQNFDMTISNIPTYALVSTSMINWRGMQESRGRRIKRAMYIDLHSIRFCDEELLNRLSHVALLKNYLREKQKDIDTDNTTRDLDMDIALNGRRQTNIGIFRAYATAWLRSNAHINQDMTFLVRQLAPTEHGLPLEVYVFSKDQIWTKYESIQADIFDHLLAAVTEFDLRIFQAPSGYDLRSLHKPAP